MDGGRRRNGLVVVAAMAAWTALSAAPAAAQDPPPPELAPLELLCPADGSGDYGFTIALVAGGPLTFDVTVEDPTDGETAVDAQFVALADDAPTDRVYGLGPEAIIGALDITLEDAIVTVTANPEPGTGPLTASLVLNCIAGAEDLAITPVCATAAGAPDLLQVLNNFSDPVTIRVDGVILAAGSAMAEGPLTPPSGLVIGVVPDNLGTVEIPVEYTHARVTLDSEVVLPDIEFACTQVPTPSSSSSSSSTPVTASTTATTAASGAQLSRTGADNDLMAQLGTVVALLGLVLLLTSHWWMRWWREREGLLADFQSWRMRGR